MKNNNEGAIVHAGFPKCASTFLQKQIFSNLKSYRLEHDELYSKLGTTYLEDIRSDSPIFKLPSQDNIIISRETFLYYDIPLAWRKYRRRMNKDIFISNITSLFKDKGKLLFIIRRQDSSIESWLQYQAHFQKEEYFFVDYPVSGSVLDEYYEIRNKKEYDYDIKIYKKAHLINKYGTTYTHSFDYFDIFKRIAAGVDKDRICILLFEDLEEDQKKFYDQLGNFIGEDLSRFVNAGIKKENVTKNVPEVRNPIMLSDSLASYRKIIPGPIRKFLRKILSQKVYISDKFRKDILNLYRENNCRLAKDFNLDLEKYGYF